CRHCDEEDRDQSGQSPGHRRPRLPGRSRLPVGSKRATTTTTAAKTAGTDDTKPFVQGYRLKLVCRRSAPASITWVARGTSISFEAWTSGGSPLVVRVNDLSLSSSIGPLSPVSAALDL